MKLFLIIIGSVLVFSSEAYAVESAKINYRLVKKQPVRQCGDEGCGTYMLGTPEAEQERKDYENFCKPFWYFCSGNSKEYCANLLYPTVDSKFCAGNLEMCAGNVGEEIKLFSSEEDCMKYNKK